MSGKTGNDSIIAVGEKGAQFFRLLRKSSIRRFSIPALIAFGGRIFVLLLQPVKERQHVGRTETLVGHVHKGQDELPAELFTLHKRGHGVILQKAAWRITGVLHKGVNGIGRHTTVNAHAQGIIQIIKHPAPFSVLKFSFAGNNCLPGKNIASKGLCVRVGNVDIGAHPVNKALHIHLGKKLPIKLRIGHVLR